MSIDTRMISRHGLRMTKMMPRNILFTKVKDISHEQAKVYLKEGCKPGLYLPINAEQNKHPGNHIFHLGEMIIQLKLN